MNSRRASRLLTLSLGLVVSPLTLSVCFGNEAGAHADEASADWAGLGFAVINFSLFLMVLLRFAWPALRDFLHGRKREIAEAMSTAARAMAEAEQIRREYAAKEAALDETCRKMVDEIREGAAADRQRALVAATEAAERLKADAERQAASELARARRELRAEAARLAARLAEAQIREKLDAADRSRLVQDFVAGVPQS
ncbi:MAG: ATP synthase F0 subunit B [Deltaproteobacteria bacterium]|nr:ATP synthase F0 subunit B [Deltaproteobacteria bacterium]